MSGILITGTNSDAGKSAIVTGLCRLLQRYGIDVAPFKAQNMSNNSMVCPDGAEIGRAQYTQAMAAKIMPEAAMNPILLKPGSDKKSFIVAMGSPAGELHAGEYTNQRHQLADIAFDSYTDLSKRHDIIICEGAGSPAEINLRSGDYVNMGLARHFNLPTLIVGDIDRGGVLASLYGTWALLEPADQKLCAGYIINKFRGDGALLTPGLNHISDLTSLPCFGVVPWLNDVWIDGEDSLQLDRWKGEITSNDRHALRIAVIKLPRISNSTDIDALAMEPGVDIALTNDPQIIEQADCVIIPGSRSTINDLQWIRHKGIGKVLMERHCKSLPIIGICGGFEMLARTITDDVESKMGKVAGLNLLPVDFHFSHQKITRTTQYIYRDNHAKENDQEIPVSGYEIHHGTFTSPGGEKFLDGISENNTFGSMLHGSFENDQFRHQFLSRIAEASHSSWKISNPRHSYSALREKTINTLADALESHLNMPEILHLAGVKI